MQIGYARCSTGSQDHALQVDALTKAGCDRIFIETASGMKADRPELKKALEFARDGQDVIVVYSLSRLARSIRNLLDLGQELSQRQIGLKSLTEAVDTTTAQGRFLFNLLGALNEMEVELLRERTRAGLAAARARGRVGGRPRALDATKPRVVKTLLASGELTISQRRRGLAFHSAAANRRACSSVRGSRPFAWKAHDGGSGDTPRGRGAHFIAGDRVLD